MIMHFKSKTNSICRQESGFTLIEALVAIALFALGILAYGVTSGSIMDTNTKSTRKSIATTLAQDKIENIKNDAFKWQVVPGTQVEVVDAEGSTTAAVKPYSRSWTITDLGAACACFFEISVTASWVNTGYQSVTLYTTLSQ